MLCAPPPRQNTTRLPCKDYSDGIVLVVRMIEHVLVASWPVGNRAAPTSCRGIIPVSQPPKALFTFEIFARLRVYGRWYFSLTRLEGFWTAVETIKGTESTVLMASVVVSTAALNPQQTQT